MTLDNRMDDVQSSVVGIYFAFFNMNAMPGAMLMPGEFIFAMKGIASFLINWIKDYIEFKGNSCNVN